METLLSAPAAVLKALVDDDSPVFGIVACGLCHQTANGVVVELTLKPWVPCAEAGFPDERIRILAVKRPRAFVVPQDAADREWKHRNPTDLGELCLWYPRDDPALQWRWEDGLLDLITIAHRHLQFEEYWRRTGTWPVEDAPHGSGDHRVRSRLMHSAADRWQR